LPDNVPDVVGRYFDLAARRDVEAIVALFTDDAIVTDEGETRRESMRSVLGRPAQLPSTSTRPRLRTAKRSAATSTESPCGWRATSPAGSRISTTTSPSMATVSVG